ncbi:hypothetical protein E3N88_40609 [Mikania micrantha]|uniref:HMA domain-containing protein n=1 Tax=Mikania micrantha TaxID=192012 RepID=A0A5N6LN21_9ASTR|nr:hypothetical protein E3N88_40609 [Mikania micrantha]
MQKNLEDLKKKKKTTQLHQFPFQEISSATDGFDQKNFIAKGGYGSVYLGEVVEQLQLALQNQQVAVSQEVRKPNEEENNAKIEAVKAQEIVLKVFLDCEGCADKVRKSLEYFKGVEKVIAQCGTDMVIVKGNIANPSELVKRVSEKISRKVELLTPPPTEELKTSRNMSKKPKQQGPVPKQENKKDKQPKEGKKDAKPVEVEKQFVLKVFLDCEGCAEKVRKSLKGVEGVEKVIAICGTDEVIVKGNIANPSVLVKRNSCTPPAAPAPPPRLYRYLGSSATTGYETDGTNSEWEESENESNDGVDELLDDAFPMGVEIEAENYKDDDNIRNNPNVEKLNGQGIGKKEVHILPSILMEKAIWFIFNNFQEVQPFLE